MIIKRILVNELGTTVWLDYKSEIRLGNYLELCYKGVIYYFKVKEIMIDFNNYLVVKETGNWRNKLSRSINDFSDLLGYKLEKIVDKETIDKIKEESTWC